MQPVKISVVIPFYGNRAVLKTIELLDNIKYVDQFIFITDKETIDTNTKQLTINSSYPFSDKVIKYICEKVKADYIHTEKVNKLYTNPDVSFKYDYSPKLRFLTSLRSYLFERGG